MIEKAPQVRARRARTLCGKPLAGFFQTLADAAVVVIGAVEADEHVTLRLIKTDSPNKTAASHICAGERGKIERTSVLNVNRLCSRGSTQQEYRDYPKLLVHDFKRTGQLALHRSISAFGTSAG